MMDFHYAIIIANKIILLRILLGWIDNGMDRIGKERSWAMSVNLVSLSYQFCYFFNV